MIDRPLADEVGGRSDHVVESGSILGGPLRRAVTIALDASRIGVRGRTP